MEGQRVDSANYADYYARVEEERARRAAEERAAEERAVQERARQAEEVAMYSYDDGYGQYINLLR
jgi:hypothetical protein